jgi:6,7-dimethyl-8-ribityllumazine synthase
MTGTVESDVYGLTVVNVSSAYDVKLSAGDLASTLNLCLGVGALGAVLRGSPQLRSRVVQSGRKALERKNGVQGRFMNAPIWVVSANVA